MLVTRGLLPWLKDGDIQVDIMGSDHCPVFIDLYDELVQPSGQTLTLAEALTWEPARAPPRICARRWDEYSGQRKLLASFFRRGGEELSKAVTADMNKNAGGAEAPGTATSIEPASAPRHMIPEDGIASTSRVHSPGKKSDVALGKRKERDGQDSGNDTTTPFAKPKPRKSKSSSGQKTIASFFGSAAPSKQSSLSQAIESSKSVRRPPGASVTMPRTRQPNPEIIVVETDDEAADDPEASRDSLVHATSSSTSVLDADYLLACALAAEHNTPDSASDRSSQSILDPDDADTSKKAWNSLLAPLRPPLCSVHKEPAKKFVVNKAGPNKGKTFYVCSRRASSLLPVY